MYVSEPHLTSVSKYFILEFILPGCLSASKWNSLLYPEGSLPVQLPLCEPGFPVLGNEMKEKIRFMKQALQKNYVCHYESLGISDSLEIQSDFQNTHFHRITQRQPYSNLILMLVWILSCGQRLRGKSFSGLLFTVASLGTWGPLVRHSMWGLCWTGWGTMSCWTAGGLTTQAGVSPVSPIRC